MSGEVVRLAAARRYYGRRLALSLDELQIMENDCLGIAGKNGTGKSTLLRVLAGITRLTSGTFQTSQAWRAAKIAFCPQSGGLYGDLTVSENLNCLTRRFSSRSQHGLFEKLWNNSDLPDLANIQVRKLSGGFQKLAMIAAGLCVDADVLILDEPTSDLHPTYQTAVADILRSARPDYLAILLSDHSDEMLNVATRKVELVKQ